MPIIYIHGVANRDPSAFEPTEKYLRRYIASEIAADPEKVEIIHAFWGDVGARFRWGGASRPVTPIVGMGAGDSVTGAEQAIATAEMPTVLAHLPDRMSRSSAVSSGSLEDDLIAGGPSSSESKISKSSSSSALRLSSLSPKQLSDLLATNLQANADTQADVTVIFAADAVAYDSQTISKLSECADLDEEWALLETLIAERVRDDDASDSGLVAMGIPPWLQTLGDYVKESLRRGDDLPGYALTRVVAEFRKPLNEFVTVFLGDVFTYLKNRGDATAPGEIPQRFLDALDKAKASQKERVGEPLIVLSHSMGGQIVYDIVTHFLPNMPAYANTKIDVWCATASQVGLFEELKLFIESKETYQSGNPVPFPTQHLGYWWNVWDHNDFISYTAEGIVSDLDDSNYNSGMPLHTAHGGYLQRPSFFRDFARTVKQAIS